MIQGFGKEKQKKLIDYIEAEIEQMSDDRSTLLDDISKLNDIYEGRIPEKNYPWEGCSNIQVPLISTHVDALLANMMNSVFQNENYWTVNPITPNTWGYAKETERFLQYGSNHVFKMYEVCQDWFKGGIKDGTGVITLNWREEYRWRYSKINEDYIAEPKLMFRGPKIESIPLENFYIPHRFPYIQRSPWCGHDFYMSWPELKGEEQLNHLHNIDDIKAHADTSPTDQDISRAEGSGIDLTAAKTDIYKLRRALVLWDIKNNGQHVPVEIIYHPDTRTTLEVKYYEYDHCRWNYFSFRYVPKEKSFYGIGVPHMLRYLQIGLDDLMNQMIDNSMIANTRFFKARKSAVQGGDDIYPGKIFWCDNPGEDLIAEQLGSTFGDITNYLMTMERWAQGRDALSENMQGQDSSIAKTKATATGTLALIQQARFRLDMTFKDVRNASQELGYQLMELYQQYSKDGIFNYYVPEMETYNQLQNVRFMDDAGMPVDYRDTMLIELSASHASMNREVEKQNTIALMGMMNGYYKQLLELAGQMVNPQMPPQLRQTMGDVAEASRALSIRVLNSFDIPDAARLIPNIQELANAVQAQPPMGPGDMGQPPTEAGGIPQNGGAGPMQQAMQGPSGVPGEIPQASGPPMAGGAGGPIS